MALVRNIDFRKGNSTEQITGTNPSTYCKMVKTPYGWGIDSITNVRSATFPAQTIPFGSGNWTIEFFAKYDSTSGTKWYASQGGSSVTGVQIYVSSSNSPTYILRDASGNIVTVSFNTTLWARHKWCHFVIVCDRTNNQTYGYINGVKSGVSSTSSLVGTLTNTASATLGLMTYSSTTNDTANGQMAYFRFYDHVFSDVDVQRTMRDAFGGFGVEKSKRGFITNKPTDLSTQVNNTLGTSFGSAYDFSTWTKHSEVTILGAKSFSTTVTNKGVYLVSSALTGIYALRKYRARLVGTTTVQLILKEPAGLNKIYTTISPSSFDTEFDFTADSGGLWFSLMDAGSCSFTTIDIREYSGLVAAYNMKPTGTTLTDISGNGYNGTLVGGVTNTQKGLFFNGLNKVTLGSAVVLSGDFTFLGRINQKSTNTQLFGGASASYIGHNTAQMLFNDNSNVYDMTIPLSLNVENTVAIVRNGSTINCSINGSSFVTTSLSTVLPFNFQYLGERASGGSNFDGEIQDVRVYNRALSLQEVKDYHNSFVKPVLVEDFSDSPADNNTVVPREWQRISGTWKVGEETRLSGELIGDTEFSGSGWWSAQNGASISGGQATLPVTSYLQETNNPTKYTGKRYRVNIDIASNGGEVRVYIGSQSSGYASFTSSGVQSGEFTYIGTTITSRWVIYATTGTSVINSISIQEIDPLPTLTKGSKYLENVTAGVLAIPSNTAYGTWEFDAFIAGNPFIQFISNNTNGYTTGTGFLGYMLYFYLDGKIDLTRSTGGSGSLLFRTPTTGHVKNTWYRIRIIRTTAGVFTVLIKGGNFTPTAGYDGWTLISVSGGSGSNPVTDTTYTTSNYFVMDLDAGDRIANIKLTQGVQV